MNSQLYDKKYRIPDPIINKIKARLVASPSGEGVKRAKTIVNNGVITYQNLKRIKNFFDYFNPENGDPNQYELAGGQDMRNWIEQTLNSDRNATNTAKDAKRDVSNNTMADTHAQSVLSNLHENSAMDNEKKNAIAVIFNDDKKILLLKRIDVEGLWGAGKWGLVGGAIEENETPEEAVRREVKEETGLKIDTFVEKVSLMRKNNVENCFVAKYNGDDEDVKLNNENTSYGWFTPEEIKFLDTVPNLMDYINIAIINYE